MVRMINLIEDTPGAYGCSYEHGLSFYIKTKHHKILFDTGASGLFLKNAEYLGLDLTEIDTVILSHGHYDHGGGLLEFAKINPKAQIYVRENAFLPYYHKHPENHRYIGLDPRIESLAQVVKVTQDLVIDEELSLFTNVKGRTLWPSGNRELAVKVKDRMEQDEFSHEQYLVITDGEKKYLISGCAHNGILNILDACKKKEGRMPDVVVSGFHMMKKQGYTEEDYEMIRKTAQDLKNFPIRFFTGHCTGEIPYQIMKEILGERIQYIHSGDKL